MAAIAGRTLDQFNGDEAVEQRKNILHDLKCGITDMGHTIRRMNNNSLDENLEIIEFMDLLHLIETHKEIERVIFTSSSGKSSALGWFLQYLRKKDLTVKFPKGPKPWESVIEVDGRAVKLFVLLSPSPRVYHRYGMDRLVELYGTALGVV